MAQEKQNVTLSLPKDLLKQAKIVAVTQNKSLSGLLADYISEIVNQHNKYEAAMTRQVKLMQKGFNMGSYGEAIWTRDDLHDR